MSATDTLHPVGDALLKLSLRQAAQLVESAINKKISITASSHDPEGELMRFDVPLLSGGVYTWFMPRDEASGFADLLVGGVGTRGTQLSEVHLGALSNLVPEMLQQAVAAIPEHLSTPLQPGEMDMALDPQLPELPAGACQMSASMHVEGYGDILVIQRFDEQLLTQIVAMQPRIGELQPDAAVVAPAATPAEAPLAIEHGSMDLQRLLGVPLQITVELGSAQRTIREVLELNVGSIIELGKLAGDPLDIKVGDQVVARGEVVVIDEEFGIRITDISSQASRLQAAT